jgi:transposase
MKPKRYVCLEAPEVITLQEGYKNVAHHQFKQRCHALLLSHQGHDMATLKTIFSVSHATISNWLTAWETKGIVGLRNQAGQGRKAILVATDLGLIKAKVQLRRCFKRIFSRWDTFWFCIIKFPIRIRI